MSLCWLVVLINTVMIACDMKSHARPEHTAPPRRAASANNDAPNSAQIDSAQAEIGRCRALHAHYVAARSSHLKATMRSFGVIQTLATLAQKFSRDVRAIQNVPKLAMVSPS